MGTPFVSFFIILLVAVIFSQLFSRMRVPWVVALIMGGAVIGPSGLGFFEADETINFLATIGLVFLMFMAGLESRLSGAEGIKKQLAISAVFIGAFPTIVGAMIVAGFGYPWQTSALMGIIFMSSSISILIPQFQEQKLIDSDLGRIIVGATIIIDAISLLLLAVFLQYTGEGFMTGTLFIYFLLVAAVAAIAWFVPKIKWIKIAEEYPEKQDLFEKELRFIILVLIGFVVFFELAGLHAIIAAFFAGLVLSGTIKSNLTKAKLHAIGYGFFIPVFFVVMGANTDLSLLAAGAGVLPLAATIVAGLIVSKFLSGLIAGKLIGFTRQESVFFGFATIPQLSTVLAVAFLGFGEGILDNQLLAAVVAMIVVTATVIPVITGILGPKLTSQHVVLKEAHEPGKTLEKIKPNK